MPSQESLRPHNTDVQVQTELIEHLGEKNKAYHVLEKIEARDVPKPQVDFTIKKEDYKGFSEAFSKALYGKGFQESTPREQNITLNVDLLLRHHGINTNPMHAGDKWHFDFVAQTFRFQGEDGKAMSGRLEKPEAAAIQRRTHEQLGDLHTSATAREAADDVAPVNPTVLDVATEKGGGSLTETFRAFYNSDMGTVKARQEWLKEDTLSVAGINKYLQQLLGDKAQSQLLKEDGTGYRGTAEQNRAWMMYIRYDLMGIKDTQEEKDREKVKAEFERTFPLAFITKLKEQFGADAPRYVKMDFAVTQMTFEKGKSDPRLGGWHVEISYTLTFLDHGHPLTDSVVHDTQARTFLGGPTSIAEDAPKIMTEAILTDKKDSIADYLALAKERAQEKESTERKYSEFGDYEKVKPEVRDRVKGMMESYFDDMESNISMTYGENVWIHWSVEGEGKEKKRVVMVEWREAYGKNIPDDSPLLKKKFVRAEIPFKFASTWKGQGDDLALALEEAFKIYKKEEREKKRDVEPLPAPAEDETPPPAPKDEPKEDEEKAPEKQTFEQFKTALDAAFDAQLKKTFGDDAKYVAFDLKPDAKASFRDGQWVVNVPYTITRTDTGEHVENVYSTNFEGAEDNLTLDAPTVAEAIISANGEKIGDYMAKGYTDAVLKAEEVPTEPIDAKEYRQSVRDARRDLHEIIRKDPVLKDYWQTADFYYDKKQGKGEYTVKYTSVAPDGKKTTHVQTLSRQVHAEAIAEIAARPYSVNLKPEWIGEFYAIKHLKEDVGVLAEELRQKAARGELVKASAVEE